MECNATTGVIKMPFHLRISLKGNANNSEYKLDLTKEQLMEKYIKPYNEGVPFIINGKTIDPMIIDRVHINETMHMSNKYLPVLQAKRYENNVISIVPIEYDLTKLENDVTDEFILGPPGHQRRAVESENIIETDKKTIFVVHGRDEKIRKSVFAFLRSIGLNPLEWSAAVKSTGKGSPYIGEILDSAFDQAQAIVVVLTPDDIVYLRKPLQKIDDQPEEKTPTPQARPNVLFEAGMAMGRDEKRTIILECGDLKPFSDIGGRHVIRMKNDAKSRKELSDRLKTAGCVTNTEGSDWLETGDFEPDF